MNYNDRPLYEILLEYGFTKVVTPISKTERFLNRFLPEGKKYKSKTHDHWLEQTINDTKYEVYEIDIWYCQLRINNKVEFDGRRFDNTDLLHFIPIFNRKYKIDNFLKEVA